jgi:hypothetical protein
MPTYLLAITLTLLIGARVIAPFYRENFAADAKAALGIYTNIVPLLEHKSYFVMVSFDQIFSNPKERSPLMTHSHAEFY